MTTNSTVMGPAPGSVKGLSPVDPPFFNPNGDLQEYRRDVSRWVDTVSAAASKGTDRMYQTVFATLGRQLYTRGRSAEQKSIVDEAQAKGLINFKQDDQTKAVKEIVELVAVDPPIAVVSRLITSFNKVTTCHRRKDESLSSFVSRFRGLAADHLLHLGLSASSQISEILAITLLNNANLSDETLTNAKLQLIALAQAREKETNDDSFSVRKSILNELKSVSEQLSNLPKEPPMQTNPTDTENQLKLKLIACRRPTEVLATSLGKAVESCTRNSDESTSFEEVLLSTAPRCRLNLDDAVTVIRNLSFNSKNEGQTYTKGEIDNIVGQKVQSALFYFTKQQGKSQESPQQSKDRQDHRANHRRNYPRSGSFGNSKKRSVAKRPRQQTFCYDCGDPDHLSGSFECKNPSFLTKRRRTEKNEFQSARKNLANPAQQGNNVRFQDDDVDKKRPGFSSELQSYETQSCLVSSGVGAQSDVNPCFKDPNPVIDPGCPRSVGGITSAAAMSVALGVDFKIEPLSCYPFFHGYGPDCSKPKLTFAMWKLPICDLYGNSAELRFFLVEGDDPLLLGNDIGSTSNLIGEDILLVIPAGVGNLSQHRLTIPTYSAGSETDLRTHLYIVPSLRNQFKTFFSAVRSFRTSILVRNEASDPNSRFNDAKYTRYFAGKLHVYTHQIPRDMKEICNRAKILTPVLSQALEAVLEKCTSCKKTGRPLQSRKVSFKKLLEDFNHHVQVHFIFIEELGNLPILHMKDVATGFSATCLMLSRAMDDTSRMVLTKWFNVYGPPSKLSGDPEFFNEEIQKLCSDHHVSYDPRPARRHNKTGIAESGHSTIRYFVQRLILDRCHLRTTRTIYQTDYEVLSRANLLKNILHGGKATSSFELANGYSPSVCCMPQSKLCEEIVQAHHEQAARRAVHILLASKSVHPVRKGLLVRGTPVNYFVRATKSGKWRSGFVKHTSDNIVYVTSDKSFKNRPLQVSYEDIRLAPSSSLLHELDKIELGQTPIVDSTTTQQEIYSLFPPDLSIGGSHPPSATETPPEALENFIPEDNNLSDPLEKEYDLWNLHPHSSSFFSSSPYTKHAHSPYFPSMDVGSISNATKDIGKTELKRPPAPSTSLESQEQRILQHMIEIVGDRPVPESRLQFAPRWIIDKAIENEKENYVDSKAYQPVSIRSIQRRCNLISSHHFR